MCIALAMILSFVESQIPTFVPIPGVKVGLANIVVIFALYRLGVKEAVIISIIRVFLVSLLFGNIMSLWYSLAGAALSIVGMIILRKIKSFSYISVSVAGGVLHNLGQIAMACILLETILLPIMLHS
jgi:Predicted membrane protein